MVGNDEGVGIELEPLAFDELRRFKSATGLPTWDAALARLCEMARLQR